jgi:hypothetical protein
MHNPVSIQKLEKLAMKLNPRDREALAERLLASVDPLVDAAPILATSSNTRDPTAGATFRYTLKVGASYHLRRQVAGIEIVIHARDASDPPIQPGRRPQWTGCFPFAREALWRP